MQTYNIFPELFAYGMIAPLILRVILGYIFINLGSLKLGKEKAGWKSSLHILGIRPAGFFVGLLGIVEIIGGLLLIAGAYTQLVALIFAIITISEALIEYEENSILRRDLVFYILLSAICVSLILTGAGTYAVDLPLL